MLAAPRVMRTGGSPLTAARRATAMPWDGMTYNATYFNTGGSGKSYFINQMAVSEVTLSTSGMSAETSSGGVSLNVVPKDGGNIFKTTVNVLYTNGSLQQS